LLCGRNAIVKQTARANEKCKAKTKYTDKGENVCQLGIDVRK
jgi:hypothetical protein